MHAVRPAGQRLPPRDADRKDILDRTGAPPALANAVMDALAPLGIRHVDIPLSQEKLWRLLRDF